jgi:propanol-preferring alcohol dehydrogenase
MKALLLTRLCNLKQTSEPLAMQDYPDPELETGEVLIQITACGVCHTELDEIEGRTPPSKFPMILGHQVVGKVIGMGKDVQTFKIGDRVGIGWIYDACGNCSFCQAGFENLCANFKATGRDAPGGYADMMAVPERSAYLIPKIFSDYEAAPLLCAGAIGFRSLNLTNLTNGQILGLTGFGASGHLVLQMTKHRFPDSSIFVFARSENERAFARELGAAWAGDTADTSPQPCDAIIDTTPVWTPIVEALRNLNRNGRLVINAIRKENVDQESLLQIDYPTHLWMEKEIKSVANVTRSDIQGALKLAAEIPIRPEVEIYPFERANLALQELKTGKIRGAKVLKIR